MRSEEDGGPFGVVVSLFMLITLAMLLPTWSWPGRRGWCCSVWIR